MKSYRSKRANVGSTIAVILLLAAAPVLAGFSGTDLLLASVGRGPGAASSQWYTTVWIENPSSSTATVQVMFLERKQANPSPVTVTVSVPAGDTVRYANILADLFSFDNKFGALRFVSDQKVVVSCRIYNLPAGGADRDTQGQDYAGIPAGFGIGKGQTTQLLGVYQTSVDKSVSPFRYSFGLAESAGGTANVHVKALDGTGAVVAEKDYGPLGAYEVEYYPIEDLSASIASTNLRLEVSMTDGTGKVIGVGSGVANQSNDGTTFEMQFADSLLAGGSGGLSVVSHDATLAGDGTPGSPLGIANGAIVRSLNGLKDNVTLAAGANITLTAAANTLTIAAAGGGGGGSGVPSVNGITSAVTIAGAGGTTVNTSGSTITVNSTGLTLPYSGTASQATPNAAFAITNTGTGYGIEATSASGGALHAKSTFAPAIYAECPGCTAAGAISATGLFAGVSGTGTNGVRGVTNAASGHGVEGDADTGIGVFGSSVGADGVYGTSGVNGVHGASTGASGYGVYGESASGTGVVGSGSSGRGVYGSSASSDGVKGNSSTGTGVRGTSGSAAGVLGTSTSGNGVEGRVSSGAAGVYGNNGGSGPSVWGDSSAGGSVGVFGGSSSGDGVRGTSTSGYGVRAISSSGDAVFASSSSGNGVSGSSNSGNGIYGRSWGAPGTGGVYGAGFTATTTGIVGLGPGTGSNAAGWFGGNVTVTGTVSKGGGSFKIDHPLDPEHKYLYHSFVESPDMMNIYNGNVVTDSNGQAVIELPEWFEALNKDFRYQLTVIGGGVWARARIAREVESNGFVIETDQPNVKVSWQVTGIRKDPFANKYRIPVEEEKAANEQGSYLHPDVYGQPEERGIEWARNPEMMRRFKQERELLGRRD